jgi:hypothetical protein
MMHNGEDLVEIWRFSSSLLGITSNTNVRLLRHFVIEFEYSCNQQLAAQINNT